MKTNLKAMLTGLCLLFLITDKISAQNLTTFEGEKTSWHGFDRYDYLMDMETMAIKPIQATPQQPMHLAGLLLGSRITIGS